MDKTITPSKNKSRRNVIAIAIGVTLFLGLFYRVYSGGKNEQNIDRSSITISSVKRGLFADTLNARGIIMPKKTVYLDSIAGGRVEEKMVERGVYVKKGDVLLRLSNAELQLNVISKEAQISEQLNFLRNTQMNAEKDSLNLEREIIETENRVLTVQRKLKKFEKLFEDKHIAEDELVEVKQNLNYFKLRSALNAKRKKQQEKIRSVQIKQLEESAIRLEENLEFARNTLKSLTVTAPVSGYLSELDVELGESKPLGSRLGQIDIPGEFKILASIDEYYLNLLNVGMSVNVDLNGITSKVQISKIDSRVNGGQFVVEVDLPAENANNAQQIKRGQSVELVLTLGKSVDNSLLLTKGAFFMSTGGNWAFVLNENGETAHKRQIKVGMKNRKYYQILTGLDKGDRVITSSYTMFDKADTIILN
ncbi:MAG: HlyD family efflux transporter periplasmic adaptor subunit [Algicola sp.]|nr:HlyD family efflux transporter periplasmic adaptor subunit [Algicola sp.]